MWFVGISGAISEAKFEHLPVQLSSSGVAHVRAVDILMSEVGREEIEKLANFAITRKLRVSSFREVHNA